MKNYTFRTIIEPDDPRGYHGFVPALKGVHTSGDTIEEVEKNLQDAVSCHIQSLIKDGLPVPTEDKTIEIIQTIPINQFPPQYA
ncbi:MAG: type II toxin-antitoxin system HicB family antitoxin [Patescibacteria group bacterium]|nr:type II toxin-antitoxin system HicB family antitoxin [Patescibacteria group bacterium]MCL5431973.1 type II toxin-antitoxin system HicB family antitoxin [Patescibacteria group bacterium]